MFRSVGCLGALLWCAAASCAQDRVVLQYWDKWTGVEAESIEATVKAFNASQSRIEVQYSAVSQIDLKLMLAIAGRRPPDVAGLWTHTLPAYVENNALQPLDHLAREKGVEAGSYIDSIWKLCMYRGRLWALPSTPSCLALHWNKKLFREAGLDPDRPPRTIEELERFNERLIKFNEQGDIIQFGHLPEEPGWWRSMWGYWFGGELWNNANQVSPDASGNVRAFEWVQSYPKRFGSRQCGSFLEGFGNFASPLNPFIQGKVAMEIQGPWMWNFIRKYGQGGFELGVAPFPTSVAGGPPVTMVESDILIIPAGARHVSEAFEFIQFVNRQDTLEDLCAAQGKFSPLKAVSDGFWSNHPHPYIRVFYDLACSPAAKAAPQLPNWNLYKGELDHAGKEIWALRAEPAAALKSVEKTVQKDLNRRIERWERLAVRLQHAWEGQHR